MDVFTQNKPVTLTYIWGSLQVFSLGLIISVWAMVNKFDSGTFGFFLVWFTILIICYGLGSFFLFFHKINTSPFSYGILLASTFILCNFNLMIGVLFSNRDMYKPAAATSTCVFAFFWWIASLLLSVLLYAWKDAMIGGETTARLTYSEQTAESSRFPEMESQFPDNRYSHDQIQPQGGQSGIGIAGGDRGAMSGVGIHE